MGHTSTFAVHYKVVYWIPFNTNKKSDFNQKMYTNISVCANRMFHLLMPYNLMAVNLTVDPIAVSPLHSALRTNLSHSQDHSGGINLRNLLQHQPGSQSNCHWHGRSGGTSLLYCSSNASHMGLNGRCNKGYCYAAGWNIQGKPQNIQELSPKALAYQCQWTSIKGKTR